MATNYFKNIYDKVIALIQADSEFADLNNNKRKPFLRGALKSADFAHEYGIMLTPINDELVESRSGGQEDQYAIDLTYFRKQPREIDYDVLAQASEDLQAIFESNRRPSTNEWHHIVSESMVFGLELPDEESGKNYYGFVMRILVWKGKY